MVGTILLFRDDGSRPHCEIALGSGERVLLVLDAEGLSITRQAPGSTAETLFRAPAATVSRICTGLVGPSQQNEASPLRILAAVVQRIGSADEVRAAFADAAASLA